MAQDSRRVKRTPCRIKVQIRARNQQYDGFLLDVSDNGMRLITDRVADIWRGDSVEVANPELGSIVGTTRWRSVTRLGIEFDPCTNTAAKIRALQRSFGIEG
jgi:hypothetical protein